MPKPFEAGKTAKELGIDTSRKFVVVKGGHSLFQPGTVLTCLERERDDMMALFSDGCDRVYSVCWHRLAYAFVHAHEEPEPYVPKVGDRVVLEAIVTESFHEHPLFADQVVTIQFQEEATYHVEKDVFYSANPKPLSRETRKLTKEEAERLLSEKLGESVTIE